MVGQVVSCQNSKIIIGFFFQNRVYMLYSGRIRLPVDVVSNFNTIHIYTQTFHNYFRSITQVQKAVLWLTAKLLVFFYCKMIVFFTRIILNKYFYVYMSKKETIVYPCKTFLFFILSAPISCLINVCVGTNSLNFFLFGKHH